MQAGGLILRDLSDAVVRSNPQYCFEPLENAATTAFSGVLTDVGRRGRSTKAVSANTAALFEELRAPADVRSVLTGLPSFERDRVLAGLVLDGIFEMAFESEFVSQCAAYHKIVQNDEDLVGDGRLAALSVGALKHGQRLGICNPEILAARLYFYHRIPVTPSWRQLWPDAAAVLRYLDTAPGSALSSSEGNSEWLWWRLRAADTRGNPHKLYVSPVPQHIRESFAEVVSLLPGSAVSCLKIGPDASALLRPDKLVVYFDRRDDMFTFAEALSRRIEGQTAHGVPFSAPIDNTGLLSWGTDPPRSEADVGWYADDSWRIWLCNRLALALVAAVDSSEVVPWRYALAKLSLSGVDTRTWTLTA